MQTFLFHLRSGKIAVADWLKPERKVWLMALLLAAATMILYWPAARNGFVCYDDRDYVLDNVHVTGGLTLDNVAWAFKNSHAANWHPVTWISHMLDCQMYGLNPWGHHLTNVLLHALNVGLIFLFLNRFTGAFWRSFFVAAIFGWHPVHVESVAWVAERKDVLSTFLGMLALLFYGLYAKQPDGENQPSPSDRMRPWNTRARTCYWISFGCFLLGMMSKPMLVTWPFVLLLLDYWPLRRLTRQSFWRLLQEKIPFVAIVIMVSVFTFMAQKQGTAVVSVKAIPIGIRCGNAAISYCAYLEKFVWPADLAVFYPYPECMLIWKVALAGIFLLPITAFLYLRRRQWPFLFMGWLWYCGTLVPVIGLVQVGSQSMADRYLYIPSVGILILIVWGLGELTRHWRRQTMLWSLVGIVVFGFYFAATRRQIGYWQNGVTLFRHAIAVTGENSIAAFGLGCALNEQGESEAAMQQFQMVLRLNPNDAGARYQLGNAYYKHDQISEAVGEYEKALRSQPNNSEIRYNLGVALAKTGRMDAAIGQYQEAIRLRPDYSEARYNLGNAFFKAGRIDEAVDEYQATIQLEPKNAEAHNNLGMALYKNKQIDEAIAQFKLALQLKPGFVPAQINLTKALERKNSLPRAF